MKELLERFHGSGKHISLYHEADTPDTFSFGTVLCMDDDFVLMQLLSLDGGYDGIALFSLDEIIRIEVDTQYAEKMNTLMESARKDSIGWQPVVDAACMLESVLLSIKHMECLTTIDLVSCADSILGTIDELGDGWLSVCQVDDYGHPDGRCYFRTSDITALYCNSAAEQRIQQLIDAAKEISKVD